MRGVDAPRMMLRLDVVWQFVDRPDRASATP